MAPVVPPSFNTPVTRWGRGCSTSCVRGKEAETEREVACPRTLTLCTPGAQLGPGVGYFGTWPGMLSRTIKSNIFKLP